LQKAYEIQYCGTVIAYSTEAAGLFLMFEEWAIFCSNR